MTRILRAAALALALSIALPASAVLAQDAGKTVMGVCTRCHNTKRICSALGQKDAGWWKATVARMAGKGAALDASGQDGVTTYLAAGKAGDKPVCE
jgi:hypothetical protein